MYKLILADGTELTDFTINGSNFVHATRIDETIFDNNLATLTIVDLDAVNPTVVIRDAKLIQQVTYDGQDGYFLSFTSQSSNGALTSMIADNYSSATTYTVGSFVVYSGSLYECNTNITSPEPWTPAHWTQVSVGGSLKTIKTDLSSEISTRAAADVAISARVDLAVKDLAPTYSSSSAYAVGDYTTYNDRLYKCTTAIPSGEYWTPAHWSEIHVGGQMTQINTNLHNLVSVSESTLVFQTV